MPSSAAPEGVLSVHGNSRPCRGLENRANSEEMGTGCARLPQLTPARGAWPPACTKRIRWAWDLSPCCSTQSTLPTAVAGVTSVIRDI